jgi:hypothetical protein
MLIFRGFGLRPDDILSSGSFRSRFGRMVPSLAGGLAAVLAILAVTALGLGQNPNQGRPLSRLVEQPAGTPQSGSTMFADRFPHDSKPSATLDASVLSASEPPEKRFEEHLAAHSSGLEEPMPGRGAEPIRGSEVSQEPHAVPTPEIQREAAIPEKLGLEAAPPVAEKPPHKVEAPSRPEPAHRRKVGHRPRPRSSWMAQETPHESLRRRHISHRSASGGGLSLPASLRP